MKIVRGLLASLLSLMLTSLIAIWSLSTVLSSSTGLNQIIVQSGTYKLFANQATRALSSAQSLPANYQAIFSSSLEKALTPERVESVFAPVLVDIVSWINQPDDTLPPALILNLTEVKTAFIKEVKASNLKPVELAQVENQISQSIPSQLDITEVNQLFGTSVDAGSKLDIISSLKQVKSYINLVRAASFWLIVISILLTALIIWLSRSDGRAMLRRPAWIYASASIFTLLGWSILTFIFRPTGADITNQNAFVVQSLTDLARAVLNIAVWYALGLFIIAIIFFGLSFFIRLPGGQTLRPSRLKTKF